MWILFLTQWFQPEPFTKGLPFAQALAAQGTTWKCSLVFPTTRKAICIQAIGFVLGSEN